MPSERQIAANRRNAKKSSGPRSAAGRARSRRNAWRHGLAVEIGTDPAFSDEIERLAKALSPSQDAEGFARSAAEAELDLLRIRRVRAQLIEARYFNPELLAGAQLNSTLEALGRYERRAFSRRKRALVGLQ